MSPAELVLVADADAATRKALALLLRTKLGVPAISEAADGQALVRALAMGPPTLLLLDWSLPGRPSPAALLKVACAHPGLRLVILSVDAAHSAEAEALGVPFMHKGASAAHVLDLLRRLVQAPP